MPTWIFEPSLRGAKLCCNPEKIIKKFCKSEFLTGLLRQLLRNFLAMTGKPVHATMPCEEQKIRSVSYRGLTTVSS
ncbi:hypothetical protein RFEPED_0249 [Rickettsia felis str. Pedreira]|uniref:Uncharacterized protein n=1 Tax=Rickettsia felis str. Pedreira TaxID=1359196 RepID=A0A0F3MQ53_RICFI|nr:hypothetical protein [Rickettsia felis]KJV57880.1 hypothetical protein RFEPED_0249 [Rickettsia felis str. Pedreira]